MNIHCQMLDPARRTEKDLRKSEYQDEMEGRTRKTVKLYKKRKTTKLYDAVAGR